MNQLAINLQTTSSQSMEQSVTNLSSISNQSYSLLDLSNEVLINILMYCGAVIKRVCKRLYTLVIESPELANIVYTVKVSMWKTHYMNYNNHGDNGIRTFKCDRYGRGLSEKTEMMCKKSGKIDIVKYYRVDDKIIREITECITVYKYIYRADGMLETLTSNNRTIHFSNYTSTSDKYGVVRQHYVEYINDRINDYPGAWKDYTICSVSGDIGYFNNEYIKLKLSNIKKRFFKLISK